MYIHYFKQGKTHVVTISETVRPIGKSTVVSGKREANKIAKEQNLTKWNF